MGCFGEKDDYVPNYEVLKNITIFICIDSTTAKSVLALMKNGESYLQRYVEKIYLSFNVGSIQQLQVTSYRIFFDFRYFDGNQRLLKVHMRHLRFTLTNLKCKTKQTPNIIIL